MKLGTKVYYKNPHTWTISKGTVVSISKTSVKIYTGDSVICINLSDVRVIK